MDPGILRRVDAGLRARAWFGVDADWERVPAEARRALRNDTVLALGLAVAALVTIEVNRSVGGFEHTSAPTWVLFLAGGLAPLPLAWRRRFPLLVLVVLYTHWVAVTFTMPLLSAVVVEQVIYFVALYTAVAWARDRRAMLVVVGGAVLVMFSLVVWQLAIGVGVSEIRDQLGLEAARPGLIDAVVAFWAYHAILNSVYFGGAILAGQMQWHAARRRQQLAEQAATIEEQALALRDQAVVAERLRIARELHDVVAHHVSVIGIQAAGARRVLEREQSNAAAGPLATIEAESREAVTQMRSLLGTLREGPADGDGTADGRDRDDRAPGPTLADLPDLAAGHDGLDVTFTQVEEPSGAIATVPQPVGLSLYRTTQEALANIGRHSTASAAGVTLRVVRPAGTDDGDGYAEVEVLDDGRTRHGTSGTGLGLLGIRERVAAHRGSVEIGPRVTGGYRVRVRLPLGEGERG